MSGLTYIVRKSLKHISVKFYLYFISLAIIMLSLFAVSYYLGTVTAEQRFKEQKSDYYPAYPSIEIFQTPGSTPKQLTKALTSGCYRQLIQNKDKVIVFKPIKSVPQADISTVVIPISHVHAMRLLPTHKLCD